MRFLIMLFLAAGLAVPAYAQAAGATHPKHQKMTLEQRFDHANITHDGHLTLEQAKAGYKSVARHFAAIDQDKKGFVTEEDIKAYYKTQHSLHHQSATSAHRLPNG